MYMTNDTAFAAALKTKGWAYSTKFLEEQDIVVFQFSELDHVAGEQLLEDFRNPAVGIQGDLNIYMSDYRQALRRVKGLLSLFGKVTPVTVDEE